MKMRGIFIGVGLYLVGEKAIVLTHLIRFGFECLVGACPIDDVQPYEQSLFALVIGTAAALMLSQWQLDDDPGSDLAVMVGLLAATFAAFLNIAEAAFLDPPEGAGDVPFRALYFYGIWIWVVIVPLVLAGVQTRRIVLDGAILAGFSILSGFVIGFLWRVLCGYLVSTADPAAPDFRTALDWMIFEPVMLTVLLAVWSVAAFGGQPSRVRAGIYCASAFGAGVVYAVLWQPGQGLGYGLICLAAILPGVAFGRGVLAGEPRAALWMMLTSGAAVAVVAGLTLYSESSGAGLLPRALKSVLLGGAASLGVLAILVAVWAQQAISGTGKDRSCVS